MKKLLSILLIVCLALSCLVACGDDEKASSTKKPSKATATSKATTKPSATAGATDEVTATDDVTATDEITTTESATTEPTATDEVTTEPTATDEVTAEPEPTEDTVTSIWETGEEADFDPSINDGIDCITFDFRGGEAADLEELDDRYGFTYLNTDFYNCSAWGENGALQAQIYAEDPYFYFYGFDEFNLQDYPVFKIVLKNHTAVNLFEMFLFEEGDPDTVMGQKVIQKSGMSLMDTEWKTYTMNFTGTGDGSFYTPSSLDRTISGIRIDCISTGAPGSLVIDDDWNMEFAYFGFFKTIEDANAYK